MCFISFFSCPPSLQMNERISGLDGLFHIFFGFSLYIQLNLFPSHLSELKVEWLSPVRLEQIIIKQISERSMLKKRSFLNNYQKTILCSLKKIDLLPCMHFSSLNILHTWAVFLSERQWLASVPNVSKYTAEFKFIHQLSVDWPHPSDSSKSSQTDSRALMLH